MSKNLLTKKSSPRLLQVSLEGGVKQSSIPPEMSLLIMLFAMVSVSTGTGMVRSETASVTAQSTMLRRVPFIGANGAVLAPWSWITSHKMVDLQIIVNLFSQGSSSGILVVRSACEGEFQVVFVY